jgi:hypothetical protein
MNCLIAIVLQQPAFIREDPRLNQIDGDGGHTAMEPVRLTSSTPIQPRLFPLQALGTRVAKEGEA